MKRLGDDSITLAQATDMIKRVDKDGNGKISYDGMHVYKCHYK